MSLESDLLTALNSICPRTYPDIAPLGTQRPYVTYQQIGGDVVIFVDNTVPSKENGLIQINVWADTRASAKTLIKQIEAALIANTSFQARPESASFSDYDDQGMVYCSRQDFSIWADR